MKLPRFIRDESGTLTVFAVITYTSAIAMAGIAIDLARVEMERTRIQLAVDNAVLAGATLNTIIDPATGTTKSPSEIVSMYLAKSDLPSGFQYMTSSDATGTIAEGVAGARVVSVSGSLTVGMVFMDMLGVDTLSMVVGAQALEVPESPVEVSLVIDVSASMNDALKLDSLVVAAKEFVTAVLAVNDGVDPNLASISLITYGGYVNAGRDLAAVTHGTYFTPETMLNPALYPGLADGDSSASPGYYDASEDIYVPINGLCGIFDDSAFDEVGLWDVAEFKPALPNSNWKSNSSRAGKTGYPLDVPVCMSPTWSEILPVTNDEAALHARLDALKLSWATSIDDGVRWGVSLLDPSMQGPIGDLTDDSYSYVSGFPSQRITYVDEPVLDSNGLPVLDADGNTVTNSVRTVSSTQAVDPAFVGRPFDYTSNSLKVLVVMSDGANWSTYQGSDADLPGYQGGWNPTGTPTPAQYPTDPTDPNSATGYFWYKPSTDDLTQSTIDDAALIANGYFQATWDDLAAVRAFQDIATLVDAPDKNGSSNKAYQNITTQPQSKNGKIARMQTLCEEAIDAGIVIYTVSYEAKESDAAILADCADPLEQEINSFTASTASISSVFAGISNSMRRLQLTQ